MPPSKIIAISHAAEFGPNVFADNGLLIYLYCSKSISFENLTSITSHLASESYKT
ncbi:2770_t:CDS:1, partial [Racocetra fulgida]